MAKRRTSDLFQDHPRATILWTLSAAILLCTGLSAYVVLSPLFFRIGEDKLSRQGYVSSGVESCSSCNGIERLEFFGEVVVRGENHFVDSSHECCKRCKALCSPGGDCECNSWVYCSDEEKCGRIFGQCWLKKQGDPMDPRVRRTDSGSEEMWTSGLIFEGNGGIVALETEHGSIRIQLLADRAPYSVEYILELYKMVKHCTGCHFYRGEGRGSSWDGAGNRIGQVRTAVGPYGFLQGTLAVDTLHFKQLPQRGACAAVRRGSVGWIGGGPDFFISLANHEEWPNNYTIFATVLPQDMPIVEKIANLPTVSTVWSGVEVALLKEALPIVKIGQAALVF